MTLDFKDTPMPMYDTELTKINRRLFESSHWAKAAEFELHRRGLNLQEHSLLTADNAQGLGVAAHFAPDEVAVLYTLGLWHDIGKPYVERDERNIIRAGTPRHMQLSVRIAEELGVQDQRLLTLILYHDTAHSWNHAQRINPKKYFNPDHPERGVRLFHRQLLEKFIENGLDPEVGVRILGAFSYADRSASNVTREHDFFEKEFASPRFFEEVARPVYPDRQDSLADLAEELFRTQS